MSGQVFYIVNSDKEREALHHSSHIDLENILTLDEADDIPEKIKLNANLNSMFVIISDNTSNSIRDGAALRARFDGRAIAFQISVHTIKKTLGDGKTVSDLCRAYSIPGRLQITVDEAVETARNRAVHGFFGLPLPFASATPKRPFPMEIFPSEIRDYIHGLTASIGAEDETMVAILVINAIRTAIMKSLKVSYPREDKDGNPITPNTTFHPNSYDGIEAKSSSGKSTASKSIMKPFREFAKRESERLKSMKNAAQYDLFTVEEKISIAEKKSKSYAKNDSRTEDEKQEDRRIYDLLERERERLQKIIDFDCEQVLTSSDMTPEYFPQKTSRTGGILALLDDEGTFMDRMRPTKSNPEPRFDIMMKAFDGDDISKYRVGNGETHAPNVLAQWTVLIQEAKDILSSDMLNKHGFNARFNWWHQEDPVKPVDAKRAEGIPPESEKAYSDMIEHFLSFPKFYGDDESLNTSAVPFTLDGHKIIVPFIQKVNDMSFPEGGNVLKGDEKWQLKQGRYICTTALVFQLMYAFFGSHGVAGNRSISRDEVIRGGIGEAASLAAKAYEEHALYQHVESMGIDREEQDILQTVFEKATHRKRGHSGVSFETRDIAADRNGIRRIRDGLSAEQRGTLVKWANESQGGNAQLGADNAIRLALEELAERGYFHHAVSDTPDGKEHFYANPYALE